MNSSQVLTASNFEDAKNAIKKFLNDINDCLYKLKNTCGYDTKELYITYDMLRYEIFTDKNIQLMCEDNSIDIIINKLNVFNSLLTDLMTQVNYNKSRINDINSKNSENYKKITRIQDNINENISSAIISILLTGSLAIHPFMIKAFFASDDIPAHEYTIDSLGNIASNDIKRNYDENYNESEVVIEKYSKVDENGYRTKTTYIPRSDIGDLDNDTELVNIDISNLSYISKEIIDSKKEKNTSPEEYTKIVHYSLKDIEKIQKYKIKNILIGIAELAILAFHFSIFYAFIDDDNDALEAAEAIKSSYTGLIDLAEGKIKLKRCLSEISESNEEKSKYEKMVNTLCNRIDKTIIECTDQIAKHEYSEEAKKIKEATSKKEEAEKINSEEQENQRQRKDKIIEILSQLSSELSFIKDNDESEVSKLYGTIQITESTLFEKSDDHLKIKSVFLPLLKFFNLTYIDFTNVDIRYIDFTNTNAHILLDKVYNKDASFAKFSDNNIRDFSDYTGINISGATLEEDVTTMVGLDNAIMDENTVIEKKNNSKKKD